MSTPRILLTILMLTVLTAACSGSQTATQAPSETSRQATFMILENDVQARTRQGDPYGPAVSGQVLPVDGQARTGSESRAQLDLMPEESIIRMGPDTEFVLTALGGEPDDLFTSLELAMGQLWIILQGGKVEVETDLGVASVRGSMMGIKFVPGESLTVTCLEGNCSVSNEHGTVSFLAGQAVDVAGPGQAPSEPRPITTEERQEWIDILRITRRGPRLGDYVWLDVNMNGLQDMLEEGLADVTVLLVDANGTLVDHTITDEEGYYSFPLIQPGSYHLIYEPPGDYLLSTQDVGEDDSRDSDPDPLSGKTALFEVSGEGQVLLDWDAGMYPRALVPDPTATSTPTATPTVPPPPPVCGCYTAGVQLELVTYDGSPGWSDCGQATACHSIIGDSLVVSGTVIGTSTCSMRVICP